MKNRDLGLLILRVGIGAMFIGHGLPKLLDGPERWAGIGAAMRHLGLDFAPAVWGFLAGLAEAGGGLLLALGAFTRVACAALAGTMAVAAIHHLARGDGFARTSHAAEAFILFVALFLIGAGRYSIDARR